MEQALNLKANEQLVLETEFNGFPIPTVMWTKDRNTLPENDKIQVLTEANGANQISKLIIKDLTSEDSGSYMATVKNPIGQLSTQSKVNILLLPQFSKELSLASCSSQTSESKTDEYKILSVNEKSQVKLDCQATGQPKPSIKWFKDDVELHVSDKIKIETKYDVNFLIIKDISVKDRGFYKVQAENNAGISFSKLFIDINITPVIIKSITNSEITITENNQSHEFLCVYQSKPKSEITWFLGDKQLSNDNSNYIFEEETNNDSNGNEQFTTKLKVQNLTLADAGSYKCKIKNCVGEISTSANLSILKGQLFVKELEQLVEVGEKNEVKLECKLDDSNPKSTVTWLKDGNPISASKRIIIGQPTLDTDKKSTIFTLIIQDTNASDSALYTLKAVSKITTIESNCQVNILSAPKFLRETKPSLQCAAGDKVTLEVLAAGKPDPEYKWYHLDYDNKEIEVVANDLINITKVKNTYSLVFNKISNDNRGKYLLRLTNNAGSIEAVSNITIDGNLTVLFDNNTSLLLNYY